MANNGLIELFILVFWFVRWFNCKSLSKDASRIIHVKFSYPHYDGRH